MANKTAVQFFVWVAGDGSSTTALVDLSTAPVGLTAPSGSLLTPNFSLSNLSLSGFEGLACSGGETVTATHILNIVTFTLSAAIPNGIVEYIYGKLLF